MSEVLSEAERLSYLSAMGIESYVPRIVLPGALPSVFYETEVSDTPDVIQESGGQQAARSGNDALKALHESLTKPADLSKKTTTQNTELPLSGATRAAIQSTTQVSVRFHWVIFQPTPAILLLIPSAHTEQNCMQLLKKILAAIGVVAPLSALENFVWPPSPMTSANSLDDAKETLHALLEGYQLKQKKLQAPIEQVLVFDENLGKVLFDNANIPGMQLRILPSLQLMLSSSPEKVAELKQLAWQRLKDLKK